MGVEFGDALDGGANVVELVIFGVYLEKLVEDFDFVVLEVALGSSGV